MSRRFSNQVVHSITISAIVSMIAMLCLPVRAEDLPAVASPSKNAPAATQIEQWIAQLDADQFNVRERAQQQLHQTGLAALEAVGNAARSGSLERTTRAVNLLLSWSESKDVQLRIAALESLATLESRPREAKLANERLADTREQAAIAAIVNSGGHVARGRGLLANGHPMLQVIIDAQWKGGVEGLAVLGDLRRASEIKLYSVSIDDKIVEILRNLPALERLQLYGTNISTKALAKLDKESSFVVDVRSGALLGIECIHPNAIPRIRVVVPNSAAEQAGLKVNDSIIEFNGEPIKDFTQLTQRITKYKPGDSVELTIEREGKQLTKTVRFQQWNIKTAKHNLQRQSIQFQHGNIPLQQPVDVPANRR